ncbi:AMP-binding protein [Microbispora catharanthi]|uniref:AMP-binding protein n=1 Tax=Microbispora catharanthi TaxID=1712871 RepID=A0A5N6BEG8_9ACTN|nr:AMP-binding protein [Microbispora catharanthi]KAB8178279.1 AMP-binding protein [Microbispora catharanthi]
MIAENAASAATHTIRTADGLLGAAAARDPDGIAIRAEYGDISFGEVDRAATMCAAALRGLLGEERCVVAIASPPHPDFVVGFHGIVRSGNIAAPINPLLPEHALEHFLSTSEAKLVFVTTELFARLRKIRHRLPRLREAVLVGPGPVQDANDIRTIDDLSAAYEVRGNAMAAPPEMAPDDVACIQFTSGTTGLPRGVLLTHRNLTVNAAQVAEAHQLDAGSIVLNHLPKYHLMHMNSGLFAGARQVPCVAPENAAAIELANRVGATHFYTIPMKLNRLAADPGLPDMRLETVRMIASGGTALAPRVARKLSGHFGVPVFQGYGLAETSPLTHSAGPGDPRPGTVGRVVADTECRIVDLESGAVLAAGERGEVQVRGPQVMKGYLDPGRPSGIDAEGWLHTGDVGYLDPDGALTIVDRIKDFFKRDNYMVSPSEIEGVLEAHPLVAESAVVGYPDEISGAVANAFVALREPVPDHVAVADEIARFVADRVPYYQRLEHIEVVGAVPRSPNGKVQRRDLRAELITRRELTVRPDGTQRERIFDIVGESKDLSNLIAVIARFTTQGDPKAFERFFLEHVEYMRAQEGFGSHQAVTLADDPSVYVNFGWWLSQEAFQRVVQTDEFRSHQATMRSMLADAELDLCKNIFRVNAEKEAGSRGEFDTPLMTVTRYRLTGSAEEFEAAFTDYAKHIRSTYGFGYADLNRSMADRGSYTGIGYWWDPAAYDRTVEHETFRRLRELADVTVEKVNHVAWNRALDADEEPAAAGKRG